MFLQDWKSVTIFAFLISNPNTRCSHFTIPIVKTWSGSFTFSQFKKQAINMSPWSDEKHQHQLTRQTFHNVAKYHPIFPRFATPSIRQSQTRDKQRVVCSRGVYRKMESGEEWRLREKPPSGIWPRFRDRGGTRGSVGAQRGWEARVVVVETRESQLISIDRDDSPRGPAWRRGAWRHGGHLCGL